MSEQETRGGVQIHSQAIGNASGPPVLLIIGILGSMLWWPEAFCRRLAERGRYVIRFDHRDTGLSTHYPPGAPTYGPDDMVEDCVAILRDYALSSAHIVGMSMGGVIAQRLAIAHPEVVRSLTLISTTPVGVEGLPPPTAAYSAHAKSREAVDWSDKASVIDFMLRDTAMAAGKKHPHDEDAVCALVEQDFDRSSSYASTANHVHIVGKSASPMQASDIRRRR